LIILTLQIKTKKLYKIAGNCGLSFLDNFHGDSNPCSKGLSEAKKVINRHFVKVHLKEKYHIFGYQKHQRNVFQNAFGLKSF
jgi:hypothetical protein